MKAHGTEGKRMTFGFLSVLWFSWAWDLTSDRLPRSLSLTQGKGNVVQRITAKLF